MLLQMINLLKTPILFVLFIIFLIIPLLFSIAFHEMAHGFVAYKFGDNTPKLMGRLTLNPIKHLDLWGTILLLTVGLGWAKPVIININNIPTPTKQMLVALAGPVSNFFLAMLFAGFISVIENILGIYDSFLIILFNMVVTINIALGVFNLIPLPPLDGSRIVTWILPDNLKLIYNKIEPYGIAILFILIFTAGFSFVFKIANFLQEYLYLLLKVNL